MRAVSVPVDLAHHVRDNVLEVAWDDGLRARLAVPLLRGWCPCAACQGHSVGLRFHDHGDAVAIAEVHEVGAYALGIRFSDGHDSGIFTWSFLRQLAEGAPPQRM